MMARLGMTFEARLAQVGDMHRAGVALIAGADSGINPAKPHGVLPESLIDMGTAASPRAKSWPRQPAWPRRPAASAAAPGGWRLGSTLTWSRSVATR